MGKKSTKRFDTPAKISTPVPTQTLPPELEKQFKNREFQGKIVISESQLTLSVPPPNIMAEYAAYYPDAAQTFFRWSEDEALHRRKLDEAMIISQIRDSRLGLWLGFIVAVCGLTVAGLAAWWGQQWVAVILGGGTIVSLATAFIRGRGLSTDSAKPRKQRA